MQQQYLKKISGYKVEAKYKNKYKIMNRYTYNPKIPIIVQMQQ